ncbi:MAG: GNAT family acetyltransferase [Desulfitibacter sp. BRH_c19]|nr:MAG: GNAT family acetyltransferase [Desulfitibacter sp. BRH_c19]
MALEIISLTDLITTDREEDIKKLLFSFCTLKAENNEGAEDVEYFLHEKAIQFEKMDLSRTYLVMSTYQSKHYLGGYFSISPRPLIISRRYFQKLSKNLQKRLMGVGHKTNQASYEIKGFLLGQLGKNYSEVATKANNVTGDDLLKLVYQKIQEAQRIVGGRILYLECEDNLKVKEFYKRNGFRELDKFKSPNGLCLMVKKIEHI